MMKLSVFALALAGVCVSAVADAPWNETVESARTLSARAELAARVAELVPGFDLDAVIEGDAVACGLRSPEGNPTRMVVAANVGDPAASLEYLTDGEFDQTVRFIVLPNFEGSPLTGQTQLFTTNDITNVSTPFGVPAWGLDLTSGPWVLIVRNDRGGQAICPFMVVPS